jgi:hypothetical protein
MEYVYLTCLAGITYAVWKSFPPLGPTFTPTKELPAKPTKPTVTLYYLENCQQSIEFRPIWEAQKSFHPGAFVFVEVECSGGFPSNIDQVPIVLFDNVGPFSISGSYDLKSYFRGVMNAIDPPVPESVDE